MDFLGQTDFISLLKLGFIVSSTLFGGFLIFFAILQPRLLYVILKTLKRDVRGCYFLFKLFTAISIVGRRGKAVGAMFDDTARKYPRKVCFIFEDQEWTFSQVQKLANQVGNYFSSKGLKKGDTVALFMENRVEFIGIWIGLAKIGVVSALINTNLKSHQLEHSLKAVSCKAIIYGKELAASVEGILGDPFVAELELYGQGSGKLINGSFDFDTEIKSVSSDPPTNIPTITLSDKLFFIYTSGTTGLPKAAIINHARFAMMALYSHYVQGVRTTDIIYTAMPLYHTAAGILGIGHAVMRGNTIVIRKKFSASNFWNDCIKHKATVTQYIGELCRYLLAQPKKPEDRAHRIRLMIGNGLRPDIWAEFISRFGIRRISEFYGSTEGNCNIVNIDGTVGAVGFIPRWLYPFFFIRLAKVDEDGELIRNPKTGLLTFCGPNEAGELIASINRGHPFRDFQGYSGNESATKKKIVCDVFKKGDAAFRSGDILIMNEYGYFYFKDRTGDTFRWKGENVSTAEVEGVISRICQMKDAAVYGVTIPGEEGRAGMSAIVDPNGTLDLNHLAAEIVKQLPSYSRPLFIRSVKSIEMTGTHKMKKSELQTEGFDVTKTKDPIFVFSKGQYDRLDEATYRDIMAQKFRF